MFGSLVVHKSDSANPHASLYQHDLPEHVIVIHDWLKTLAMNKFEGHYLAGYDDEPQLMLINGAQPSCCFVFCFAVVLFCFVFDLFVCGLFVCCLFLLSVVFSFLSCCCLVFWGFFCCCCFLFFLSLFFVVKYLLILLKRFDSSGSSSWWYLGF